MKPLARSYPAERGQAQSVPRGDAATRGIVPQAATGGPAWKRPGAGPKFPAFIPH